MEKILLPLLFCLLWGLNTVKAQLIVEDPANVAINTAIHTLSEGSNKLQNFMAQVEKMKYATDALETLHSVKQIANLLDQLLCLQTEFQLLYNANKTYSCATFLNIQMVTFNLSYTTDIINKVVLAKNLFTMTQSEHLNTLENIRKTLENTIKEMQFLNSAMRMDLKRKVMDRYLKKNYYSSAKHVSYSRYKK